MNSLPFVIVLLIRVANASACSRLSRSDALAGALAAGTSQKRPEEGGHIRAHRATSSLDYYVEESIVRSLSLVGVLTSCPGSN